MKQTGAHCNVNGGMKGEFSVTTIHTGRSFRRQDGSGFIFLDGPAAETREIRRHRAQPDSWGEASLERFAAWLRRSQKRFDLALAVICFFLVMGAIFLGFGEAAHLFFRDPSVAWTFWAFGIAFWAGPMTFFFYFLNGPSPRHGVGG